MFLAVIAFTIVAQWAIVEFGGDFTQTAPLDDDEWYATVLLGFMSIPVGFIMRQIPVREDPDSFAGIGAGKPKAAKKGEFGLVQGLSLIAPVVAAAFYHFARLGEDEQ